MTTVTLTLLEAGHCVFPEHFTRGRGGLKLARLPATFALIEHPRAGLLLFETGYGTAFFRATRRWPNQLYARLTPVTLREEQLAVHQLARRGLRPADLSRLLISHFHADHVSALGDFPAARFSYWPEAWAAVRGRRGLNALRAAYLPEVMPADFEARAAPLDPAALRPLPPEFAPFRHGVDLFCDESVLAVPLPGHAVGQLGLLVRPAAAAPVFLVADACWHSSAFREDRPPHALANLLFADAAQYRATLHALHALHTHNPAVELVPAHCAEACERHVAAG
ncbi:MAG: MBL fold metallo-hydrolase [Anaerolineales bacterium]|nr:MBL fold metallo-hydrolase [Anaerolineales bacterium]